MNGIMIRRIDNTKSGKQYLRNLPQDTLRNFHGLFVVETHTRTSKIQKVYTLEKANSELKKGRLLYHVVTSAFTCECTERNWNAIDVMVRLKIRILPEIDGFAELLLNADAWDKDGLWIYAHALDAVIKTNAKYGLATYVHQCLEKVDLELLKKYGAQAWPRGSALPVPWLRVECADHVSCQPHKKIVEHGDPIKDINEGTMLCGRYRLIERLGQGGMGQVWKAYDTELKKNFAVKILAENADEDLATSIEDEARILSELSHPNIATMRGYHVDGNVSFMLVDLIEGKSLDEILFSKINDGSCLTEEEVEAWLKPIAAAIDYVHSRNRVHRDIKPQNIMIGYPVGGNCNRHSEAFLCDFGIASENGDVAQNGWGTPPYRAPEIEPEAEVTAAADVYSFAFTMLHCLIGHCHRRLEEVDFNKSRLLRALRDGLSEDPLKRPEKCISFFEAKGEKCENTATITNGQFADPDDGVLGSFDVPENEDLKSVFSSFDTLLYESPACEQYRAEYKEVVLFPDGWNRMMIHIDDGERLLAVLNRIRIDYMEHRRKRLPFFNEAQRRNLHLLVNRLDCDGNQTIHEVVRAIRNCIQNQQRRGI